jgi:hypothetical protein
MRSGVQASPRHGLVENPLRLPGNPRCFFEGLRRVFRRGTRPTRWTWLTCRYRSIQEAAGQGERTRLPGGAAEDGLPDPEVEADGTYQNMGKNPIRTGIRVTHPAGEATNHEVEGLTKTAGLQSSGWLVAKPGGAASGSVSTRRRRTFDGQLPEKRQRRPASLPTRIVRICSWKTKRNP